MEEVDIIDVAPDDSMYGYTPVEKNIREEETPELKRETKKKELDGMINPLRKEIVRVQYIPKERTGIEDKNHPFYGGLVEGAKVTFVVPMLRNGSYTDPLTKSEKEFLEEYMDMEPNTLSVHKTKDNFWDSLVVEIGKEGLVLDLSNPMDYIKYCVLRANKTSIAPSIKDLQENDKESYRFVLVTDGEVSNNAAQKVSLKAKCWKEYGKIENDAYTLRTLIEVITGKMADKNSKLEFLQETVTDLIDDNPKFFYTAISDPLLSTKVLIKKGVDTGVIQKKTDYYYFNNAPLCNSGENATLSVAAKYLATPRNQELKFTIEAKINS